MEAIERNNLVKADALVFLRLYYVAWHGIGVGSVWFGNDGMWVGLISKQTDNEMN